MAFFPGTFDPFSAGHKEIVRPFTTWPGGLSGHRRVLLEQADHPKLLRRKIAAISVADPVGRLSVSGQHAINLASPEDLAALAEKFPGRELYLAAGSDVIFGASAYQSEAPARPGITATWSSAGPQTGPAGEKLARILRGKWQLVSLPAWCEGISSTQIREYVDKNLDISMLVDPIVQSYIYANGLYLRSPQFKNVLAPGDLYFERARRARLPCRRCCGPPWTATGAAGAFSCGPFRPGAPGLGLRPHRHQLPAAGNPGFPGRRRLRPTAHLRAHHDGRQRGLSLPPDPGGLPASWSTSSWPGA